MKAKKWILAKKFTGVPNEENLKLVEEEIADELKPGEILLQAIYLSVDPYMRVFTSGLQEGDCMIGEQMAEVLRSRNGAYPIGSLLLSQAGWRSHFISNGKDLEWIQFDLGGTPYSYCLGALGMPGAAAYIGLYRLCDPKQNEIVLVNAAAGAVGSLVGQLAKLRGCKVIGFVGSDEKLNWCKNELGFDYVFNYKTVNLDDTISQVAPNGVDVFFDNVGGHFYNTIIKRHLKPHGRICVCGSIENYNNADVEEEDLSKIIKDKHIHVKYLSVYDHKKEWPHIHAEMNKLIQEGKLKVRETRYEGIEKMRDAFYGLFKGDNIGKAIIKTVNENSNYRDY